METCFPWGCSPSYLLYSKLIFSPHKLTFLKQKCIKKPKPNTTTNQGLPASSLLRSTFTSSPLTAHTLRMRTVNGEAPANLGRSGEEGWPESCHPDGVFAGCDANFRAKQSLSLHVKLLPKRCRSLHHSGLYSSSVIHGPGQSTNCSPWQILALYLTNLLIRILTGPWKPFSFTCKSGS